MDKKTKAGPRIAEIAGEIFALLEPLTSEDRHKVINGSLVLLGEASQGGTRGLGGSGPARQPADEGGKHDPDLGGLPPRVANWMSQNGLTTAQIERVFDIAADGVTVIASEAPGTDAKNKTRNAYVLQGVSHFLASGDSTFDDKSARKVCEDLGCYNKTNHATYMKDKGNVLTGSKAGGWKLTAPGLKHGADLVKELTKEG